MNRKETTAFLSKLLEYEKFCGPGKYYASEVSLDYGTKDVKRVDFMQFVPVNQMSVDAIEKGEFISYEVKSCKADFMSGFGQNFETEKNYFVMPMSVYKELMNDIPWDVGVLCPVPNDKDKYSEFENPTELDGITSNWRLRSMRTAYCRGRKRSMAELLFCMLRSGR